MSYDSPHCHVNSIMMEIMQENGEREREMEERKETRNGPV
jgi:hypothetical protein